VTKFQLKHFGYTLSVAAFIQWASIDHTVNSWTLFSICKPTLYSLSVRTKAPLLKTLPLNPPTVGFTTVQPLFCIHLSVERNQRVPGMSKVKGPLGPSEDSIQLTVFCHRLLDSSCFAPIHPERPLFVLSPGLYEGGNESISVLFIARSKRCFLVDVS